MKTLHNSILLFFLSITTLFAQDSQVMVSGRFEDRSVSEIVRQLCQEQSLQLFISNEALLQQRLTIEFDQVTLEAALNRILAGTPADYLFYRNYSLIVGPRSRLNQSYSGAYYSKLEEVVSQSPSDDEIIIGDRNAVEPFGSVDLSGVVVDDLTQEVIVGASLILEDSSEMTISNANGGFNLSVPSGKQRLIIQSVGYDKTVLDLRIFSADHVEFALRKNVLSLEEVTIEAVSEDVNVASAQVGVTRLDMKGIDKIPVFMGEVDIEKVLLLQPGVSKIAEGSAGFNVRGGEVDQNLVVLDEGFLLNSSHALGFLSTFNPDMVQSVELYKGTMPAYYGGRLASALDVKARNGDFQKFKLKAGISPITGRLNIETPVIKDKSSINVGLRYNYADLILKLGNTPDVRQSSSFFYDGQLRYAHKINDNNTLEVSFYVSNDEFRFSRDFGFDYQTIMGQLSLKSQISDKLFSKFSVVASEYQSARQELDLNFESTLDNAVVYYKIKEHLTYTPSDQVRIDGGLSLIRYEVDPGSIRPTSESSSVQPIVLEQEQSLESALFLQGEWNLSQRWSVSGGLRAVFYQYLGPKSVLQYNGLPDVENIVDTLFYEKGDIIESYNSLEPRFSFRYRINPSESIKGGYSRTVQYINQISNFTAPTPSSIWQLSNTYIEPSKAHNFSLGFFKNYRNNLWETSVEGYYRAISDLIEYQDFADLNVNDHLETELLSGEGRSYGLELSVKKKRGLFNGWVSYTLSRTERQVDEINNGDWYLSNLDKTHDLSVVGIFDFNERHSITINFNYATGRPTTAPIGSYLNENGLNIPIYSSRNEFRIPDFHRLDVSYTVGQGYNRSRRIKTSWIFSIFNLYGRKNPYSVFFTQKPFSFPTANRFSVLGSILPSVSFNIEFQ